MLIIHCTSDDDIWSFIRALRRPIRPLARTLLVDQCIRQPSLLRVIGDQVGCYL
jgi:hypothetical protein